MASRIQGITVEIGGDITKLTAALKSVNTNICTTQSQLRDVNNLLELAPGNTGLLAQKHRLLAQAVVETKEKLETLKAAAEQANEALAKGEITQKQYDGLQREIIETGEKLKNLEQQANQSAVAVQKIGAVGEDLKNLGDKISGVGTTLIKTVTTSIAGLGTVAVKTATDFDVRPAAHVSNGCKSRIRPVVGRIQPKARVSIVRWNLKEAGCGEHTNPRANLWSDEQKSHRRLCMRVRLHHKPKPNNYTESCMVNVADIWRERNVWYQGRSVGNALKGVTVIAR